MDLIGSIATALVVGVGGLLVLGDQLTAGVLIAFVLYVDRFFDPIRELAQRYNTFQATMAGSERIFNLLDTAPELADKEGAETLPPVSGRVDFNGVDFWYKPDEIVLDGFTLSAEPGERIALVGETGAGKSTVVRLLARFFDVTGGAIEIDGHDIRDVTQAESPLTAWHRVAGPVPVQRDDCRQHPLRQAGRKRWGDRQRGQGRGRT